jgi:membrane protease YdiL (CAAX protease family)
MSMSVRQSSGIRKVGPWAIALAVTLIVAVIARFADENWSATAVGLTFLAATYWLCVAGATTAHVRACGLSLGGLFESESINFLRMARDTVTAAKVALLTSLAIFPLFWLGFVIWWHPTHSFVFRGPVSWNDELLGQAVVVALPEEAFYRGYLMNSFDQKDSRSVRILGTVIRPSLFWSSALFALGHFATEPNVTRLAVFFPALLFAWLRNRTGGIGAGIIFHVLCNVFASTLGRGYGLWQ